MTNDFTTLHKAALSLLESALEQSSDTREVWIKNHTQNNPELCALTLELLQQDSAEDGEVNTGGALLNSAHDEQDTPEFVGSYRITELIGRGGMGAVYRAERAINDFEHDVAIKVIRPGIFSEKLIQRFELERQTLAKLSHPHIARLFDGGTIVSSGEKAENGSPYIVMEYIDGVPIDKWVDNNDYNKKQILQLFLDACAAVRYAHQNLVIHRDITPSNVLVDNSGQVKLIDFGIAKPLSEYVENKNEQTSQSLVSMSFTPGFAAPERLSGGPATTLSDVFSLGRLLQAILYSHDIDGELKAIIAKSTQSNLDARYLSVDALIDDINAYQHNFAVNACEPSKTYRLQKFVARHKAGVVFTCIFAATIISALMLTTYQYKQAEIARKDASKRFNDVRNLATTMMNEIHDEVYRVPGTTKATVSLINAAQYYLDELASEAKAPDDVKLEAAVGYTKLGTMVAGAKLGTYSDLNAADQHFSQAKIILSTLVSGDSPTAESLTALGKLYYYMAEISIQPRRKYDLAEQQLNESVKVLTKASALYDDELGPKLALMYSSCYLGEVLLYKGEKESAKQVLSNCVSEGEKLAENFPENEAILRLKSAAGRTLGNAFSTEKNYKKAVEVLNQAVQDLSKVSLLVETENDNFFLRAKTMAYWRRAYAFVNLGEHEKGIADYIRALDITNLRLQKDPKDKDANWFYYTIQAEKATPLQNQGRTKEAIEGLEIARDYYLQRHIEKPQDASRLGNLFYHYYSMTDFYKNIENRDKECEYYASATKYFALLEKNGQIPDWEQQSRDALEEASGSCKGPFK